MINLVTTMSRYLMILLILIYTYYNFRAFCRMTVETPALPSEECAAVFDISSVGYDHLSTNRG